MLIHGEHLGILTHLDKANMTSYKTEYGLLDLELLSDLKTRGTLERAMQDGSSCLLLGEITKYFASGSTNIFTMLRKI